MHPKKILHVRRLRSDGMQLPEAEEFSASLVSRMASLPATHDEMLRTRAASHMMQDLAQGSPRVQEAAIRGLVSLAGTQRQNGISVPGSPMKVHCCYSPFSIWGSAL